MITHSGAAVFPREDTVNHTGQAPTLEDIGRGLGRAVRFAGQVDTYYTVLCHTIVAVSIVEPKYAHHLLLHDAHEAILSDTVTTWKNPLTKDDEHELDELIYASLGLDLPNEEEQAVIKAADLACLAAEAHILGHAEAEKYWPKESFGELEQEAFALTVRLLQQNAPMVFLDGVKAGHLYKQMIEQAVDPDGFAERQKIKAVMG